MIIGLTGLKRSGKDTVADYLNRKYDYQIYSFADPIKYMIKNMLSEIDYNMYYFLNDAKEESIPILNASYRKLAQTLGTDWGRNMIDENLWINLLEYRIEYEELVVIPDVRFNNEAEWIASKGGKIFKVVRDTGMVDNHSSESGIYDNYISDYLYNDSSLQHLYKQIDNLVPNSNFIEKNDLQNYLNGVKCSSEFEKDLIAKIKNKFKI